MRPCRPRAQRTYDLASKEGYGEWARNRPDRVGPPSHGVVGALAASDDDDIRANSIDRIRQIVDGLNRDGEQPGPLSGTEQLQRPDCGRVWIDVATARGL